MQATPRFECAQRADTSESECCLPQITQEENPSHPACLEGMLGIQGHPWQVKPAGTGTGHAVTCDLLSTSDLGQLGSKHLDKCNFTRGALCPEGRQVNPKEEQTG